EHRIETPVGVVTARLHDDETVSVQNVASYRLAKGVKVEVDGHGEVSGDVAWGGNWFFLVDGNEQELDLKNVERLMDFSWRVRRERIRGVDSARRRGIDSDDQGIGVRHRGGDAALRFARSFSQWDSHMSGATADVVIVGAGIIGAACARALAREGLSVIVVES